MTKKKRKGYPFEKANENGDIMWVASHFSFTCCDCGLRHTFTIDKEISPNTLKTNKQWLALRAYRDDNITNNNRKVRNNWKCKLKR